MSKKIEVNALINFDNIKIIATTKIKNDFICLHNEKINLSKISNISKVKANIKNILKNIENKTLTKVKRINIIFDDFMKKVDSLSISTKIIQEKIDYNEGRFLSFKDCEKILNAMIEKSKSSDLEDQQLISVVPFEFIYVENGMNVERKSSTFPINKKIQRLWVTFSIRYMSKKSYLRTIEFFDMMNIKINNIALKSQIAIYSRSFDDNQNEMNYTLAINKNRTLLISSVNNVAIRTETLNLSYTFENLVRKIENKFEISKNEAKSLISCYGNLNVREEEKNQIIYCTNEQSKVIRRFEIVNIIKSFLKSVCTETNSFIKSTTKNNLNKISNLKIIGELSNIDDVSNYCSKYFENVSIIIENQKDSLYTWNEGYTTAQSYYLFMKILKNKIYPDTFYYSNYNSLDKIDKSVVVQKSNDMYEIDAVNLNIDAIIV